MEWEEAWYYFTVFQKRKDSCLHYFPSLQVFGDMSGFPTARYDCGLGGWECFWELRQGYTPKLEKEKQK